jgi:hypothetical protein
MPINVVGGERQTVATSPASSAAGGRAEDEELSRRS